MYVILLENVGVKKKKKVIFNKGLINGLVYLIGVN